jgi:multicomponent Na+:H+ antiporter subunit D
VIVVLPLAITWFAAVLLGTLDGRKRWVLWCAVAALAASLAALVVLALSVAANGAIEVVAGGWSPGVGIALRADALGTVFAVVSSAVLLVSLVYESLRGVEGRALPSVVLFLATGLTGLFLTGDAFNFYVFFEIAMVSSFVLAGYGMSRRELRAALVFTVVNLLGSVTFLSGIAALYHVTGTLDMRQIAARMLAVEPNSSILIATLIFTAFSLKLGLFPFHFWLPPVYRDTRPAISAILSGAVANIGSYGLLRFGADILPVELRFGSVLLLVIGSASLIYGALLAVSGTGSSDVLAYSSIGQAGYILVALAVGGEVGYAAAILYAVLNAANKTLLFLSAELRGPLVGAAFVIGAFSVAGIPPSAGFLGKAALFQVGIQAGSIGLVALIFVGGALSVVYMLRIYQRTFWLADEREPSSPLLSRLLVMGLAVGIIGIGLFPEPLLRVSRDAAVILGQGQP